MLKLSRDAHFRFVGKTCHSFLVLAILVPPFRSALAQSFVPSDWTLIAHYPLRVSADDTTGNYGPMYITGAPFQNGGLFMNGIGTGSASDDYSDAVTPRISAMNFDALGISVEFNTDSLHRNPVLNGGNLWRWAAAWIRDDSLMELQVNNGQGLYVSPLKWSTNTWHETGILVDGDSVSLYLDRQLGVRSSAQLDTGDDRTVTFSDGGFGITFYGTVRNLKIYTKLPMGTAAERRQEIPNHSMLIDVYPNPITGSERMSVLSGRGGLARISVFDILGREVWNFGTIGLNVGDNRLPAIPDRLRDGLYIVRVEVDDRAETRPVIIAR